MTGRLDNQVFRRDGAGFKGPIGACREKKPILPLPTSDRKTGRLSMVGLALGYLALVMVLSTAPFWHQTLGSQPGQPAACTDFGGSR